VVDVERPRLEDDRCCGIRHAALPGYGLLLPIGVVKIIPAPNTPGLLLLGPGARLGAIQVELVARTPRLLARLEYLAVLALLHGHMPRLLVDSHVVDVLRQYMVSTPLNLRMYELPHVASLMAVNDGGGFDLLSLLAPKRRNIFSFFIV
jgi:hypothetical protein